MCLKKLIMNKYSKLWILTLSIKLISCSFYNNQNNFNHKNTDTDNDNTQIKTESSIKNIANDNNTIKIGMLLYSDQINITYLFKKHTEEFIEIFHSSKFYQKYINTNYFKKLFVNSYDSDKYSTSSKFILFYHPSDNHSLKNIHKNCQTPIEMHFYFDENSLKNDFLSKKLSMIINFYDKDFVSKVQKHNPLINKSMGYDKSKLYISTNFGASFIAKLLKHSKSSLKPKYYKAYNYIKNIKKSNLEIYINYDLYILGIAKSLAKKLKTYNIDSSLNILDNKEFRQNINSKTFFTKQVNTNLNSNNHYQTKNQTKKAIIKTNSQTLQKNFNYKIMIYRSFFDINLLNKNFISANFYNTYPMLIKLPSYNIYSIDAWWFVDKCQISNKNLPIKQTQIYKLFNDQKFFLQNLYFKLAKKLYKLNKNHLIY